MLKFDNKDAAQNAA